MAFIQAMAHAPRVDSGANGGQRRFRILQNGTTRAGAFQPRRNRSQLRLFKADEDNERRAESPKFYSLKGLRASREKKLAQDREVLGRIHQRRVEETSVGVQTPVKKQYESRIVALQGGKTESFTTAFSVKRLSFYVQLLSGALATRADPRPDTFRTKRPTTGDKDVECDVRWTGDGMSFVARTGSGHLVAMDGAPAGGGNNLAPRPMEMVLVGTGGCSAYDVVLILKRGRHEVRACDVKVTAERAAEDPKVFTRIEMKFTVRGRNLNPDAVVRAVQLSHEKYCSATAMLARTAEITHSVEILED